MHRGSRGFEVYSEALRFPTKGPIDFVDLTERVVQVARRSGVKEGLVHLFVPYSTGILAINEFTEDLLKDIRSLLESLAPSKKRYEHPWNAHSHLRSLLLGSSQTLPLLDGRPALGTWQSIFFIETDVSPRQRTMIVQVMGERILEGEGS